MQLNACECTDFAASLGPYTCAQMNSLPHPFASACMLASLSLSLCVCMCVCPSVYLSMHLSSALPPSLRAFMRLSLRIPFPFSLPLPPSHCCPCLCYVLQGLSWLPKDPRRFGASTFRSGLGRSTAFGPKKRTGLRCATEPRTIGMLLAGVRCWCPQSTPRAQTPADAASAGLAALDNQIMHRNTEDT